MDEWCFIRRSSGVQKFRSAGVQEFRSSEVADDTFSTILYIEQIKLTSATPVTPALLYS
jgi:hypothetical protein